MGRRARPGRASHLASACSRRCADRHQAGEVHARGERALRHCHHQLRGQQLLRHVRGRDVCHRQAAGDVPGRSGEKGGCAKDGVHAARGTLPPGAANTLPRRPGARVSSDLRTHSSVPFCNPSWKNKRCSARLTARWCFRVRVTNRNVFGGSLYGVGSGHGSCSVRSGEPSRAYRTSSASRHLSRPSHCRPSPLHLISPRTSRSAWSREGSSPSCSKALCSEGRGEPRQRPHCLPAPPRSTPHLLPACRPVSSRGFAFAFHLLGKGLEC